MKRIVSFLLTVSFVLSVLTVAAFAREHEICDADRWVVDCVDITVQTPSEGAEITEDYELHPSSEGFYVADISWDPIDTHFKAGVSYSVTITVETEEDFTFNLTDPDMFWINTGRATILSRSEDQIKVGYTFAPVIPNFIDVSYDYSAVQIMLHENFTLEAKYNLPAGATDVTHQWYVADTARDWGTPIEGATGKTLGVPNDEECVKYYRCHVTCKVDGETVSSPTEEFFTVMVEVKGSGLPSMFFEDVNIYDWFYHDVEYVYYDHLMYGIDETHFGPDVPTTRGMIVTVLYRMEGSPEVNEPCPFTDVRAGEYYEKPIIWAEKNGIVKGMGDGTYEPDTHITREQLAAILCRFAKFKNVWDEDDCVMTGGFSDLNKISSWASEDISWAVGSGMLAGSQEADGLYIMPQGNALRSHFAAMLHRFYKYFLEV